MLNTKVPKSHFWPVQAEGFPSCDLCITRKQEAHAEFPSRDVLESLLSEPGAEVVITGSAVSQNALNWGKEVPPQLRSQVFFQIHRHHSINSAGDILKLRKNGFKTELVVDRWAHYSAAERILWNQDRILVLLKGGSELWKFLKLAPPPRRNRIFFSWPVSEKEALTKEDALRLLLDVKMGLPGINIYLVDRGHANQNDQITSQSLMNELDKLHLSLSQTAERLRRVWVLKPLYFFLFLILSLLQGSIARNKLVWLKFWSDLYWSLNQAQGLMIDLIWIFKRGLDRLALWRISVKLQRAWTSMQLWRIGWVIEFTFRGLTWIIPVYFVRAKDKAQLWRIPVVGVHLRHVVLRLFSEMKFWRIKVALQRLMGSALIILTRLKSDLIGLSRIFSIRTRSLGHIIIIYLTRISVHTGGAVKYLGGKYLLKPYYFTKYQCVKMGFVQSQSKSSTSQANENAI